MKDILTKMNILNDDVNDINETLISDTEILIDVKDQFSAMNDNITSLSEEKRNELTSNQFMIGDYEKKVIDSLILKEKVMRNKLDLINEMRIIKQQKEKVEFLKSLQMKV